MITTCVCGRVGLCSTCCCVARDHDVRPDSPCSLCDHVGRVTRQAGERDA